MNEYILAALLVWNIIVFFLYGADKRRAKKNKWRVSEKALLLCAFLMGGVGALAGMSVLRHKTRHWKFRIGVPAALIFNAAIVFCFMYYFS